MITNSDVALIVKALSDETRQKIIDMLSCQELCACAILEEFQITQPTLSYHMKILVESGLVVARKDGSWMRYKLDQEEFCQIKTFLDTISSDKDNCICRKQRWKSSGNEEDGYQARIGSMVSLSAKVEIMDIQDANQFTLNVFEVESEYSANISLEIYSSSKSVRNPVLYKQVYVRTLNLDCNFEEIAAHFSQLFNGLAIIQQFA